MKTFQEIAERIELICHYDRPESPRLRKKRINKKITDILRENFGEDNSKIVPEDILSYEKSPLIEKVNELKVCIEKLETENKRLKNGQFTKEEIHNICHNLHGTVNVHEFAKGCEGEMVKLYGRCPWTEKVI